jgi:hypothetical protein
MRKDAGAQHDDCEEEGTQQDIGGAKVDPLGKFVERLKVTKGFIDVIE